jgi:DDE superfamily endonuclease
VTYNEIAAEGRAFVYQVRLPLSSKTLRLVTQAVRTQRAEVGSRWRKLPDLQAALIVLAVLRHDQRPNDVGAAHGISGHTVRRWLAQTVTVLARAAPRLDRVLARAARAGVQVLLLDGCCLPVQRPRRRRAARARWCPKHKASHLRVLTLTDQAGRLLWISAAIGAATHEATHAKRHHIPPRLRARHLALICDRAHTRLDDQPDNPTVITGRRGGRNHKLTPAEHTANALVAAERAANEHAHAHLKNWRYLHRLRHGWAQHHATELLRALLVLTNTEINR